MMRENQGKWTASQDEEYWNEHEFFDTREEAVAFGLKRAKESGWTVFYVGQVKAMEIRASGLGDQLLDAISTDHYDNHGEFAEDYLTKVDKEHLRILDEKLEEVVRAWADEYGYQPDYFLIEGTEEIIVERESE